MGKKVYIPLLPFPVALNMFQKRDLRTRVDGLIPGLKEVLCRILNDRGKSYGEFP